MIFLIFTTAVIITLFVLSFIKLVKNNSFEYTSILIIQFVGICIDFIAILIGKNPSILIYTIIYFLAVFIPIAVSILESKKIFLHEFSFFFNRKNIDKETLLKIIDKHPNSYMAHKKLAEYYRENKENEKAENEYIRIISLKPEEYENYYLLADIYMENNKRSEAVWTLQEALKIKPDYSKASIKLGNILYENENFKEAILILNEAIKYNPKEYDLYYCLGMNYTRINDFNNAKECYKKAATINSLQDISNLNVGQIYLIFEEYDNAEEYFYKTINSEDDEIVANSYFYLAKIRLIQRNEEQAIQYANLALEFNPEIIKKMQRDEIFISILGKLRTKTYRDINTNLTDKDKKTIEHLGKTFSIVETLTNNFYRNDKNKEKEIEENF